MAVLRAEHNDCGNAVGLREFFREGYYTDTTKKKINVSVAMNTSGVEIALMSSNTARILA